MNSSANTTIAIIGAGAWGSALAINFSKLFKEVFLICHTDEQTELLQHPHLDVPYSKNISLTVDYNCIAQAQHILIATPSYAFSEVLTQIKPLVVQHNIAWATKGFAGDTLLHTTFAHYFPQLQPCLISGPSFASEVAFCKPTALVVSSPSEEVAKVWANLIGSPSIKTYISTDIVGCEVGGAVKNILAIAAGISSGLGFGANTMSALITRGLAEMTRFGEVLGAKPHTFTGLSGLGDLTLTCLDDKSRNRQFGKFLVECNNTQQAIQRVGATVEGLNALPVVLNIAHTHSLKMPICFAVARVLEGEITPEDSVAILMQGVGSYE
jgi:glycerol-3-phosphate dehydrogenase (NAD(P)+)